MPIAICAAAGVSAGAQTPTTLNEDFDCYPSGAAVSTLGGWELWPGGADAVISGEQAFGGAGSLQLRARSDIVHRFSGYYRQRLTCRMMLYIPSSSRDLSAHIIALNEYDGGGPGTNWSMRIEIDGAAGLLTAHARGDTTPIVFDRWIELRAEVRLDWAEYDLYYDGALWAKDMLWLECAGCPGIDDLAAIELFVAGLDAGPGVYIDDVVVGPAGVAPLPTCGELCYADCDGSEALDLFDFLCFQSLFGAGDPLADCSQDGALTFYDLLCFQHAFGEGCS